MPELKHKVSGRKLSDWKLEVEMLEDYEPDCGATGSLKSK